MNSKIKTALVLALIKDSLDALVDAGYLVTLGALAIVGIPFLILADGIVAVALWSLFDRDWMVLPVFVWEAFPVAQVFPTWTAFVLYMAYRHKDKGEII